MTFQNIRVRWPLFLPVVAPHAVNCTSAPDIDLAHLPARCICVIKCTVQTGLSSVATHTCVRKQTASKPNTCKLVDAPAALRLTFKQPGLCRPSGSERAVPDRRSAFRGSSVGACQLRDSVQRLCSSNPGTTGHQHSCIYPSCHGCSGCSSVCPAAPDGTGESVLHDPLCTSQKLL